MSSCMYCTCMYTHMYVMRLLRKDIGTRHAVHSHVCNGGAAERKAQGPDIHTGPDMHRVQTCTGSSTHSWCRRTWKPPIRQFFRTGRKRSQAGHGLLRSPQCCESEIVSSSVPRQEKRVEILGLYYLHRTKKLVVPSGWRSISFGVLHLTSQAVKEGRLNALKDTQPKGYQC